jgi:hypothetical protein
MMEPLDPRQRVAALRFLHDDQVLADLSDPVHSDRTRLALIKTVAPLHFVDIDS